MLAWHMVLSFLFGHNVFAADLIPPVVGTIPRYRVDLSKAPRDRWSNVLSDFIARSGTTPFVEFYSAVLEAMEQKDTSILKFYRDHAADFENVYAKLYPEELAEMRVLAETLQSHATNAELHLVSWDRIFLAQLHMQIMNIGPLLGECTSVVVRLPVGSDSKIIHFRNWDFGPRADALGSASVTIDFQEPSGKNFTCLLALTHITKWTTCVRPGAFSMSLNARGFGDGHERGRSPEEELRLLQMGRWPRVEVLRRVMRSGSYKEAVATAALAKPLTSMYVILANGGADSGRDGGAVVTLMGNGSSTDVLPMPGSDDTDGWFLAQTNVDHWVPTSQSAYSSHRRDHVKAMLRKIGPEAIRPDMLLPILLNKEVYPAGNAGVDNGQVFRNSTIASVVMAPGELSSNRYEPFLWKALPTSVRNLVV